MKKSKGLSDFFEKTGTYINMSNAEKTKANKKLLKQKLKKWKIK